MLRSKRVLLSDLHVECPWLLNIMMLGYIAYKNILQAFISKADPFVVLVSIRV